MISIPFKLPPLKRMVSVAGNQSGNFLKDPNTKGSYQTM